MGRQGVALFPLLVVFPLFLSPSQAVAITWNFAEEGHSQGWWARANVGGPDASPLRAGVRDGIWRITPASFAGRPPNIQLISPALRLDAALFDQVRIRLRVVHRQPIVGVVQLGRILTASLPFIPNYLASQSETFTTDWQEITIKIQSRTVMLGTERVVIPWEGEVFDVRIQ
jgi:hypothetical protein